MNVRTILVPTDFSEDAAKAVETAKDLARTFQARIVILHAYHLDLPVASPVGAGYALPQGFYDDLRSHATARVEAIAKELTDEGFEAKGVAHAEPASFAIVAEAERLPADLIVMGTRGRTGIKHVVLGSVAERVVRMAPCPVVTVKA